MFHHSDGTAWRERSCESSALAPLWRLGALGPSSPKWLNSWPGRLGAQGGLLFGLLKKGPPKTYRLVNSEKGKQNVVPQNFSFSPGLLFIDGLSVYVGPYE